MNDQTEFSALKRKAGVGRVPSEGGGMTPAKAFCLANSKAAQVELGLAVRVQSVKEDLVSQAQLLEALDGDALLMMLEGPQNGRGVAVFDMQAVSALIEVQTLGMVVAKAAVARAPTRTDSFMCEAMLNRMLQDFEAHLADGSARVWATGFRFDKPIESLRLMGLALEDIPYRLFHLQLDFADGSKQGLLQIALPAQGISRKQTTAAGDDGWAQAMEIVVGDSHVMISAVLHRVQKTLTEVQALQVGDEIGLPKSSISAISMEGSDGCFVGVARLGQQNGHRALRMSGAPSERQARADPVADIPAVEMPNPLNTLDMEPLPDPNAVDNGGASFPVVDIQVPDIGGGDAPLDDLPDLQTMPMENMQLEGDTLMAAMPTDIEIV